MIRKVLIISKTKANWRHRRKFVALAVDIVPSDNSKGGSPLSELPGLAVLWTGGRGCPEDKRPPCYLCVKGYEGLTEEAKATAICVFHTRWCCYLNQGVNAHRYPMVHSVVDDGNIMKDALSEKVQKSPDMLSHL